MKSVPLGAGFVSDVVLNVMIDFVTWNVLNDARNVLMLSMSSNA
jgi:hypothetical protein